MINIEYDSIGIMKKLHKRNNFELEEVNKSVNDILKNIKSCGDRELLKYTEKFDNLKITEDDLKVRKEEIEDAYNKIDKKFLEVLKKAKSNIWDFHEKQKKNSWINNKEAGIVLGQIVNPLERVGVYTPGGSAAYPSSVLMNVIPAKVAGVEKVIMVTPPKKGGISPTVLVAADIAGVDEIYKVGGAQGIGALAYGTNSIPKVDKIVGPGNIYVSVAKKMVYGHCDIDMFAGPSEIMVIADKTANPEYITADLLSQAEHDEMASSILITNSEKIAIEVKKEIENQVQSQKRKDIINKSINNFGAIIVVESIEKAFEISNQIAPEHLELCIKDPFEWLGCVKNAGAVFLGNYTPEPIGDYYAGPNHVLPTSGTARFFSPLNINEFTKKSSLIYYSKNALEKVKDDIVYLAESEGLYAHGDAIKIRFKK